MNYKRKTGMIAVCSMNAAILILCSVISMPTVPPFTLQSLGVFVLAGSFCAKISLTSYMIYLLLGAMGLPVFSGLKGGISVLLGPTGGYLFGFLLLIVTTKVLINAFGRSTASLTVAFVVGMCVLYITATVYYAAVWLRDLSLSAVIRSASVCVLPFLLTDTAKLVIAVYIIKRFEGGVKL